MAESNTRTKDPARPVAKPSSEPASLGNLAALRLIPDPADRALAAAGYITAREQAIADARGIRDTAIADLLRHHGVTDTARRAGVSVSTVKAIRKAQS